VLLVSRKESESIRIEPAEGVDLSMTLRELFERGPILVTVVHTGLNRVRLAVHAPRRLGISRTRVHAWDVDEAARVVEGD
jgi:sRNA-binding carbon storage regulator CsrA